MTSRKNTTKPTVKKSPNFRSGFEKKVAKGLKERGVEFEYEKEKIRYNIPASDHNYIPDFIVSLSNGEKIFIEAKGNFDRQARAKMALVIEQNPDKDIRLLFMRNNKIAKNSKTTYTAWCEQRKIKCAVSVDGAIPEEWLSDA